MATAPYVRIQDLPKLTDSNKINVAELLLVVDNGEYLAPTSMYISSKVVQVLTPAEKGIARDNLGLGKLAVKDTEIEDTASKVSSTWSSVKITDYVAKQLSALPKLNDLVTGDTTLWSSTKTKQYVDTAISAVPRGPQIDDTRNTTTEVWSSSKTKTYVDECIADVQSPDFDTMTTQLDFLGHVNRTWVALRQSN